MNPPKIIRRIAIWILACLAGQHLAAQSGPGLTAGLPPLKDTNYEIPTTRVYFVATYGNDANPGTPAAPFLTISKALNSIPKGRVRSTVVIRGGIYREVVADSRIPSIGDGFASRLITLQPYPHEKVWILGSAIVTGWVKQGALWRKDGWTVEFSHSVSVPNFIDPAYPIAHYPDLVFIDGRQLRQVASLGEMTGGTFFVDYAADVLYIGDDPTGKMVEAGAQKSAIYQLVSTNDTIIRGLGFAHFASHLDDYGAIKLNGSGIVFENNTVAWNAGVGLFLSGEDNILIGNQIVSNGNSGLGGYRMNRFVVEQNVIACNNQEHFSTGWGAAGAKLARGEGMRIRNNLFEYNLAKGLWLDISVYQTTIVSNTFRYNDVDGLMIETSSKAIVASNLFIGNKRCGFRIGAGTNDVDVYNNTFIRNTNHIGVIGDNRRNTDAGELALGITWITGDVVIKNNILSNNDGTNDPAKSPFFYIEDFSRQYSSESMLTGMDYNGYFRGSSTIPTTLFHWWSNSVRNFLNYASVAAFNSSWGFEKNAVAIDNQSTNPFFVSESDWNYRLRADSPAKNRGEALPPAIASALSWPTGVAVDLGVLVWPTVTSSFLTPVYFPRVLNHSSTRTLLVLDNPSDRPANISFKAYNSSGQLISGNGVTNPVLYTLAAGQQLAQQARQLFGDNFITSAAWVEVLSDNPGLKGFYAFQDDAGSFLDGASALTQGATQLILPEVEETAYISLANPNLQSSTVKLRVVSGQGSLLAAHELVLNAKGYAELQMGELFTPSILTGSAYLSIESSNPILATEVLGAGTNDLAVLNAQDAAAGAAQLWAPHYPFGGGLWQSVAGIINPGETPSTATAEIWDDSGVRMGQILTLSLAARGKASIGSPGAFGISNSNPVTTAYLRIISSGAPLLGSVRFSCTAAPQSRAILPLASRGTALNIVPYWAQSGGLLSSLVSINAGAGEAANVSYSLYAEDGRLLNWANRSVPAIGRDLLPLDRLVPQGMRGYATISYSTPNVVFGLVSGSSLSPMMAVAAQPGPTTSTTITTTTTSTTTTTTTTTTRLTTSLVTTTTTTSTRPTTSLVTTTTTTSTTSSTVAILYRRIFPKIYLNHPSQIASLALLNPSSTPATVHFKAYSNGGSLLVTAQRTLQPNGQLAQLLGEILNTSNSGTGWLLTETTTPNVEGFFLLFDNALTWMDGAGVSDRVYRDFILPIGEGTETSLVNPGNSAVDFNLSYISEAGLNLVTAQGSIPALGRQTVMSDTLRPQGQRGGYLRGTCSGGVVALQVFGNAGWAAMLEATDPAAVPAATGLYAPQFAVGGGYQSTLDLINLENTLNIVTLTLIDDQGRTLGQPASVNLPPRGSARLAGAGAFGLNSSDALVQGYVRLQSSGGGRIAGSVTFTDMEQRQFGSALNFVAGGQTMSYVSQVAQDAQYFTGLAAINPNARPCTVTVTVFDTEGKRVASGITQIAAGGRFSRVLPELVAPFPPMTRGYFQVESTEPLACFSLFGTYNGSVLAAIPPHRGAEK